MCLCKQRGHGGQFVCPLLTKFGTPLKKNDADIRSSLSMSLPMLGTFPTSLLPFDEDDVQNIIYTSLPTKIRALIIHERYERKSFPGQRIGSKRYVLRLTLLTDYGLSFPGDMYTNAFFEVDKVMSFITRSKTNLIVSQIGNGGVF